MGWWGLFGGRRGGGVRGCVMGGVRVAGVGGVGLGFGGRCGGGWVVEWAGRGG